MKKQDITHVRTAAALEQKYLGRLSAQGGSSKFESKVAEFMVSTNSKLAELEGKITAMVDYTVTFMADGEIYEIVSVKKGNSIDAPVTEPTSEGLVFTGWQNDGNIVEFPFTPTENTTISALFISRSNTDYLYESFGVDKATFPYVVIGCTDKGDGTVVCGVWFANKFSDTNGRVIIPTGRSYKRTRSVNIVADISNQDDVCAKIVEMNPSVSQASASSQPAYTDSGTTLYYTNDQTDTFSFVPEYLT